MCGALGLVVSGWLVVLVALGLNTAIGVCTLLTLMCNIIAYTSAKVGFGRKCGVSVAHRS